jgi:hypothetical protein
VILVYPLALVAAAVLAWQRRTRAGGHGPRWFLAWTAVGFLLAFSFVTGLSIGIFIAPVAAALLIWVAMRSPHGREASGLIAGAALVAVLVAALHT